MKVAHQPQQLILLVEKSISMNNALAVESEPSNSFHVMAFQSFIVTQDLKLGCFKLKAGLFVLLFSRVCCSFQLSYKGVQVSLFLDPTRSHFKQFSVLRTVQIDSFRILFSRIACLQV